MFSIFKRKVNSPNPEMVLSPAKHNFIVKPKIKQQKHSQMFLEWVRSDDGHNHDSTGVQIMSNVIGEIADENKTQNEINAKEEEQHEVTPIQNIQPMVSPRGGSETKASIDFTVKKVKKSKKKRRVSLEQLQRLQKYRKENQIKRILLRQQESLKNAELESSELIRIEIEDTDQQKEEKRMEERIRLFAARRSQRLSFQVDVAEHQNDSEPLEEAPPLDKVKTKIEPIKKEKKQSLTHENEPDKLFEDSLPAEASGVNSDVTRKIKKSTEVTKKKLKRQKVDFSVVENPDEIVDEVIDEIIEEIWHVSLKQVNNEPVPMFIVKWEGFPPENNTVEPYEHVQHADCVKDFVNRKLELHGDKFEEKIETFLSECRDHQNIYKQKPKSFVLAKLAKFDVLLFKCNILATIYTYNNKIKNSYDFFRILRYQSILYKFHLRIEGEKAINQMLIDEILAKENNSLQVVIENTVDFETVPKFEYLRNVSATLPGCINSEANFGCECIDGCYKSTKCCPKNMGVKDVYDEDGRICAKSHQMIVECNEFCSCDLDCPNRPKRLNISLRVFKTAERGWALKTMERIPAGKFVIEYTGELIDEDEAKKRSKVYDKAGLTYLFDLDYNETGDASYSIDATYKGNLSRFINHSCEANLQTWPATSYNENIRMHRLYYFSLRTIRAGEELTVDYCGGVHPSYLPSRQENAIACKCGSALCKGYIF